MQLPCPRLAAATALLAASSTLAVPSAVQLPYATYDGLALSSGVTQWLGMRYAAPPTGPLRFRPPQDPVEETEPQPAHTYGNRCLVTGSAPGAAGHAEDCLFVNVHAPTAAKMTGPLLPVLVWLRGDGYGDNAPAEADVNATGILAANENDFVVVTFNHRLGPYGFLATGRGPGTNNGLRDQVQALAWVRRFIRRFGGDPEYVTLGGSGMGAQHVMTHLAMFKGSNPNFNAVIAESPSFAPMRDLDEADVEYHRFARQLGCESSKDNSTVPSGGSNSSSKDTSTVLVGRGRSSTHACLLRLDADAIQQASRDTALSTTHAPPWDPWVPVIDYDLIASRTFRSMQSGHFAKVPFLLGNMAADPGTAFSYRNRSGTETVTTFMHDLYPGLLPKDLAEMEATYASHACITPACFQAVLGRIDQDARHICPTLAAVGRLRDAGVGDAYLYLWDVDGAAVGDADLGPRQNIEAGALWGAAHGSVPNSFRAGGANELVPFVKQRYWTNFVRSHNPNRPHKSGKARNDIVVGGRKIHLAYWGDWWQGGRRRLVFGNDGKTKEKTTAYLRWSCTFWDRMAPRMRV